MVNVKLFMADGGKLRGLQAVPNGIGTLGAVPEVGDYIILNQQANTPGFKVEVVSYLMNEDAVRVGVSPIAI
jgi:hypothetical protein